MGGGSETEVKNIPSPEQSEAFRFRMDTAKGALGRYASPGAPPESGAAYFTDPSRSPYRLTEGQLGAIENIKQTAANLPPLPSQNWAMQQYPGAAQTYWNAAQAGPMSSAWEQDAYGLANALGSDMAQTRGAWETGARYGMDIAARPIDVGGIAEGAGGVDWRPTAHSYGAVDVGSMAPVTTAREDPARARIAAQDFTREIALPSILNTMQAQGLGGGAATEAIAQQSARYGYDIEKQILDHAARANELDANIKARQEEVQLLELQKARLQAQQLTARSDEVAQQIQGQIEGIEAQIQGNLAIAEFQGKVQANIAQRQSELGYAQNVLGQYANMTLGQQQLGGQVGTNLLGQRRDLDLGRYQGMMSAGATLSDQLNRQGLTMPALEAEWYKNALMGGQTGLQAESIPQQMAMAEWQAQRDYILSLIGAAPLGPGGTQQSSGSSSPSGAQMAGAAAGTLASLWT